MASSSSIKYWEAACQTCGTVRVKQKTKPTSCKEQMRTGPRSLRLCGNRLKGVVDITAKVEAALLRDSQSQEKAK
ncbi:MULTISPECIES: hypothetical protein [Herbaspirillum]|uniref:Uncharacterized protein n=2 Tax=Herbaspirillum huttiense TaxID=863372 RepID=A0AAJ2H4X3_9BURK|nr:MULTISPECIES: hypothetical protein [Herbaspirillum]MDR9836797.1 hypothetical protein [Herbaspirillum huttiense]